MSRQQRPQTTAEVIRNRRRSLHTRQGYISLLIRILLLSVAGYLLFTQIFLITRARGNDMFPAIKDGDLVIAFRLQQDYVKNEVVIYHVGDTTHLGRIVARENDIVTLNDSGTLIVNGAVQRGEIVYLTLAKEGIIYPFRVPPNSFFLLGDHRMEAIDSRDYGPVERKQVQGKVITILRRRGI